MFPENFLTLDRVSPAHGASSKKRALEAVSALLASTTPGLTDAGVFDKLLERERLGSTGLGQGIALPHARMEGVNHAYGAFIKLSSGIDFDALDGQPVDLVFGLMVPQEATDEHLQLLAELARLFSSAEFCTQLRNSSDAQIILNLMLNADTHAASA